jgi:glycosyltransferase involved in cell wall biosynthesis
MISGMPSITIVIFSFNYADFLSQAVDSALEEDCAAAQVIVVDDGSSAGSADLTRSYCNDITAVFHPMPARGSVEPGLQ